MKRQPRIALWILLPSMVFAAGNLCSGEATEPTVTLIQPRRAPETTVIQIPPSPSFPQAPWPRGGVTDYTFAARSHGGAALGVGVDEFDWTLQVDARTSALTIESFRSDANTPGHPIGLFRMPLTDQQLRDFLTLVENSRIPEVTAEMAAHPGETETLFIFRKAPSTTWQKIVNNSDHDAMAALAPLMKTINSSLARGLARPERAVRLSIAPVPDAAGSRFEVSVTNIGVDSVCFDDPRSIVPDGPNHQAVVRVTEFPETGRNDPPLPMMWRDVALAPADARAQSLVVLNAGQAWRAHTVPWGYVPGTRYLAYAFISNYKGEPMVRGTYRIRGQTASERIVTTP
jgi:hypothetical protein